MSAVTPLRMFPIVNEKPDKIPGGYYLKARCIQDSAIAHAPPHVREIWDYLIKEANHGERKTHGTIIRRGQLFTDYKEIIDALSWREGFVKKSYKKHHVDYAMRWLRQELMITTDKTTRGLIITICKYDIYQNSANYENANDYDTITTRLRQPTTTIHKNDKNEKNGKEVSIDSEEKILNEPFEKFWDLYDKKVGDLKKLQTAWEKLKDGDRAEIIEYLPAYVASTPDKKFRKNPYTFLNQKSWKDEIINKTPSNATHSTTPQGGNKRSQSALDLLNDIRNDLNGG